MNWKDILRGIVEKQVGESEIFLDKIDESELYEHYKLFIWVRDIPIEVGEVTITKKEKEIVEIPTTKQFEDARRKISGIRRTLKKEKLDTVDKLSYELKNIIIEKISPEEIRRYISKVLEVMVRDEMRLPIEKIGFDKELIYEIDRYIQQNNIGDLRFASYSLIRASASLRGKKHADGSDAEFAKYILESILSYVHEELFRRKLPFERTSHAFRLPSELQEFEDVVKIVSRAVNMFVLDYLWLGA